MAACPHGREFGRDGADACLSSQCFVDPGLVRIIAGALAADCAQHGRGAMNVGVRTSTSASPTWCAIRCTLRSRTLQVVT